MCVVCEREDEAKTDKHELESGLKGHHVAEDVKMRVTMKALDGERKGRGKGSRDDGGVRGKRGEWASRYAACVCDEQRL
ncbi:hypothetical protein L1887_54505 [Cichorium endivia]|nr:hypothetical protein L1887_54505 [Cichorium endivia]